MAVADASSILGPASAPCWINTIEADDESATFMEAWKVVIGLMFILVVLLPAACTPASSRTHRTLLGRRAVAGAPVVAAGE